MEAPPPRIGDRHGQSQWGPREGRRKGLIPKRIERSRACVASELITPGTSFPRKTGPCGTTSAASSTDRPAFWLLLRQDGRATQPPRRSAPRRTCAAPSSQRVREAPPTRPWGPIPHCPPPVHCSRRHESWTCCEQRSTGSPAAQAAHAPANVPPESRDRPTSGFLQVWCQLQKRAPMRHPRLALS